MPSSSEAGGRRLALLVGGVALVVVVLIAVVLLVRPGVETYRVPSESMVPTFGVGARVTVNTDAYADAGPRRGDIVVFRPPAGATASDGPQCGVEVSESELCPSPVEETADVKFVKRVVAGPGDRLRIDGGKVILNGTPLRERYARACGASAGCDYPGDVTVPDGHYFMLGDNRGFSDDSRFWGPVPRRSIIGRVDDCAPLRLSCSRADE